MIRSLLKAIWFRKPFKSISLTVSPLTCSFQFQKSSSNKQMFTSGIRQWTNNQQQQEEEAGAQERQPASKENVPPSTSKDNESVPSGVGDFPKCSNKNLPPGVVRVEEKSHRCPPLPNQSKDVCQEICASQHHSAI